MLVVLNLIIRMEFNMNPIDRLNAVIEGIPETSSFKTILKNGTEEWRNKKGQLHRVGDLPAIIHDNGTKKWYQYGKSHRDNDKPAIIWSDGSKYWYKNDELHRDNDEPAIIRSNGYKAWYKNNELHRDNDKPAIIEADGTKYYFRNGTRYEL
jgi:hypothetical protein